VEAATSSSACEFHFGNGMVGVYPPLPRSREIIGLAENLEVIHGAQQLRGKILSSKDLALIDRLHLIPLSPWLGSAFQNPNARAEITSGCDFRH